MIRCFRRNAPAPPALLRRALLTYAVDNPATGEVVGNVPNMDASAALQVAQAAIDVQSSWGSTTAASRAATLERLHCLVMHDADALAALITAESGKPIAESRGEVAYGASFLKWFSEEARRAYGRTIPSPIETRRLHTIQQPVGPCLLVTPFNFPLAMLTRKIGPALAAGCTAVCKPAEDTPLTAIRFQELCLEAGVPAGVVGMVTCDRSGVEEVSGALCDLPDIRKVSFTGSTPVGKWLLQRGAGTVKRMSMELGGNAPFIVFEDADLDAAVDGFIASKFRFSGQTCVCADRLYLHQSIHDDFIERLTAKLSAVSVGAPDNAAATLGPVINSRASEKLAGRLQAAVAAGAEVVLGGSMPLRLPAGAVCSVADMPAHGDEDPLGLFVQPTVLVGASMDMDVIREENFGPIAAAIPFSDEAEVVAQANAVPVGLAAYAYTRDIGRAFRVSERLAFGMVGINAGVISTEVAPFGGVKESGMGREGGAEGLAEYMDTKYVAFDC